MPRSAEDFPEDLDSEILGLRIDCGAVYVSATGRRISGVHKAGFGKGGFSNEACFQFAH